MEEGAEAFVSVLSSPVSVFVAAPSLVFPPFSLSLLGLVRAAGRFRFQIAGMTVTSRLRRADCASDHREEEGGRILAATRRASMHKH